RDPDVDVLDGEGEAAWCHAHDLERLPIDADAPADGARVGAELLAPEAVGDDDSPRNAVGGPRLVRLQRAAQLSADTEDVEEVAGDTGRLENTRRAFAGEGRHAGAVEEHGDALERLHLLLPI